MSQLANIRESISFLIYIKITKKVNQIRFLNLIFNFKQKSKILLNIQRKKTSLTLSIIRNSEIYWVTNSFQDWMIKGKLMWFRCIRCQQINS